MRPANLWYSRGNPDEDGNPATNTNNGCPEFPRERGVDGAPNYGAIPRQLCPYATANGATVMNGPVYRFDEDATDDSRPLAAVLGRALVPAQPRRREHQARAAARSGDGPGRRPAGLRGQPAQHAELAGQLHGLEVRSRRRPVRAGLRRVLPGEPERRRVPVRLHRRRRTRRAPTRRPRRPAGRRVAFSVGRSGGVSYRWDFGDGRSSTSASPTHNYGRAGTFDVTLDRDLR